MAPRIQGATHPAGWSIQQGAVPLLLLSLLVLFLHAPLSVSSLSDVSRLSELETYALSSASARASLLRSGTLRFDEPQGRELLAARQCQLRRMEGHVEDKCRAEEVALVSTFDRTKHAHRPALHSLAFRHAVLALDDPASEAAGLSFLAGELPPPSESSQLMRERAISQAGLGDGAPQADAQQTAAAPSSLDPELLRVESLLQDMLRSNRIHEASPAAWEWVAQQPLSREQLDAFLSRLDTPALTNLVPLLARDLLEELPPRPGFPRVVQFGSRTVHHMLSVEQLKQLGKLVPELTRGVQSDYDAGSNGGEKHLRRRTLFLKHLLIKDRPFSNAQSWMSEELPDGLSDDEAKTALADKRSYLESLWELASTLPRAVEELRARVQFHVLFYEWRFFRAVDPHRMREYLRAPRRFQYGSVVKPSSSDAPGLFTPFADPDDPSPDMRTHNIFVHWNAANEAELIQQHVRAYFQQADDPPSSFWGDVLEDTFVQKARARARLTSGTIQMDAKEREALEAVLSQEEVRALRQEVVLRFGSDSLAAANPRRLRAGSKAATLRVQVKNVPSLLVNVYELSTRALYLSRLSEPDGVNIALEGLLPSHSHTIDLRAVSPMHQVERTLSLTSVDGKERGVWIVEISGGGHRTRAVVRKGGLTAVHSLSHAGHLLRILDVDTGASVPHASVSMGSTSYPADATTGLVLLPFKPSGAFAAPQTLVLHAHEDDFAALFQLDVHMPEEYKFTASMHVEQEALMAGRTATLLVRPTLTLQGQAVSSTTLRKASLLVDLWDNDDAMQSQLVEDITFSDDAEFAHSFLVPPALKRARFTLRAEVTLQSTGAVQAVEHSYKLQAPTSLQSGSIESFHMRWTADAQTGHPSYHLLVLGRTGEPLANRRVRVTFQHAFLLRAALRDHSLQSDAQGRIELGELSLVTHVNVQSDSGGTTREWQLGADGIGAPDSNAKDGPSSAAVIAPAPLPTEWSMREGDEWLLPAAAFNLRGGSASAVELFEDRGGCTLNDPLRQCVFVRSLASKHVTLVGGAGGVPASLRVAGLPRGRYVLFVKGAPWGKSRVHLTVAAGQHVMSDRVMDRSEQTFVRTETNKQKQQGKIAIVEVAVDSAASTGEEQEPSVRVLLRGVQPSTRVHVASSHFAPALVSEQTLFGAFGDASAPSLPRVQAFSLPRSSYLRSARLGDEQQYVLDRQAAVAAGGVRVGNMLPRPTLLLHPHARSEAHFDEAPVLRDSEQMQAEMPPMAQPLRAAAFHEPRMFASAAAAKMSFGTAAAGGAFADARHMYRARAASESIEFLRDPARLLSNLRPTPLSVATASGATHELRIPRAALGIAHSYVSIVATDKGGRVASAQVALPALAAKQQQQQASPSSPMRRLEAASETDEQDEEVAPAAVTTPSAAPSHGRSRENGLSPLPLSPAYRDLRLSTAFSSQSHYADAHLISALAAGETLTVSDLRASSTQIYATVADAFALLRSLAAELPPSPAGFAPADDLAQLSFLPRWPRLSRAEKLELYGAHGCHELHLFLSVRDRSFFDEVVRPVLRNKLQPEVMDLLLLDDTDDTQQVATWSAWARNTAVLERMNVLEQLLLANRLAEAHAQQKCTECATLGKTLFQRIQAAASLQTPLSDDARVRLFNRALRSRTGPSEGGSSSSGDDATAALHADRAANAFQDRLRMSSPHSSPTPELLLMDVDENNMPIPMSASAAASAESMASFDELASDLSARAQAKRLYVGVPVTKEYMERGYYSTRGMIKGERDAAAKLVRAAPFWADLAAFLARHPGAAPSERKEAFLSRYFPQAASSVTEILAVVSFLDLPFEAAAPIEWQLAKDGRAGTLTAGTTPLIVFHKELRQLEGKASAAAAAAVTDQAAPVSVFVQYTDPAAPFLPSTTPAIRDLESDEPQERFVDEFLVSRPYEARVVISNGGARAVQAALLLQLPMGALPLEREGEPQWTGGARTQFVRVPAYASRAIRYRFYFPAPGSFPHYPAQLSRAGQFVAASGSRTLRVVDQLSRSQHSRTDWPYVSVRGTDAEVLTALRAGALSLDLSLLGWRLARAAATDSSFFRSVVSILQEQLVYSPDVYAFTFKFVSSSLAHEVDRRAVAERLAHLSPDERAERCGPYFRSSLLSYDESSPLEGVLRHLEYSPLVLPRAYPLRLRDGDAPQGKLLIQSQELRAHYQQALRHVAWSASGVEALKQEQLLAISYLLLLQDRVDEARDYFLRVQERIEGSSSETAVERSTPVPLRAQVAYDYLTCYFAFFKRPAEARAIADKYAEHPLPRVRALFAEVRAQLAEIDAAEHAQRTRQTAADQSVASGDTAGTVDAASAVADWTQDEAARLRALVGLGLSEPSLDFRFVSPRSIEVRARHVSATKISFYPVQIEQLFSASPFTLGGGDESTGAGADASAMADTLRLVTPAFSMPIVELPQPHEGERTATLEVQLPAERLQSHGWIEVSSVPSAEGEQVEGKVASPRSTAVLSVLRPHASSNLLLEVSSAYGHLHALDGLTGAPLSRAYVKVYARDRDGAVQFFKDGTTDWRGRFEYASLSTNQLENVERFALLVVHEELGAVVKQVKPPRM